LFTSLSLGDAGYKNDDLTAGNGVVLTADLGVKQAAVFPAVRKGFL
jgi:hypothetical protein